MNGEFAVKNAQVNAVKRQGTGWGLLVGSLVAASVILGFLTTIY